MDLQHRLSLALIVHSVRLLSAALGKPSCDVMTRDSVLVGLRCSARGRRAQISPVVALWLTSVFLCSGLEDKPAEIDTGIGCKKLENHEHGEYRCRVTAEGELCKLMCHDGYALPINEYNHDGQHILLENRGIYNCTNTPGGWMWRPSKFYDCIPKVYPAYFVYYYSLTIKPHPAPCLNDSDRERLMNTFEVNTDKGITKDVCLRKLSLNCHWTYDMRCLNRVWLMDAWMRMPFSVDMLERFQDWYSEFENSSQCEFPIPSHTANESVALFTVPGQLDKTVINRHGFYIECPKATRIDRDYSCRGCSRGYYMSQSLLECLPCPAQRYQDQDYAHTCKPCPAGGTKETTGLAKLIDCFHFSYWEEATSIERLVAGLGSLVLFSTLVLYYRSQVRNEPDGKHREVYMEPKMEALGGGPLQRAMRLLYPVSMFPSQFDNMSVSAQPASGTTTLIVSRSGKRKVVMSKKPTSASSSSSGSSESSSDS